MNKILIFFVIISFVVSCTNHKKISRLSLIKAYEVKTHNAIEPSGLTLWDGKFYTVSDKENTIFQLLFNEDSVELKPVIKIEANSKGKLDFEGISHDDDFFYVVSERYLQILKISRDGKQVTWLPKEGDFKSSGQAVGLFQTHNAYIEGLCVLGDNHFLLAAERQPRGFVEYRVDKNQIIAYQKDEAVFDYSDNRSPDFTGLSCDDGLYVLDRNAYAVAKIKKKHGQYIEVAGFSYEHIIKQEQYQYQDMKYGHAEGLVVKGDTIYLILDNNRNGHLFNKDNNNSLFLKLKK
jgi:hypothetical protein